MFSTLLLNGRRDLTTGAGDEEGSTRQTLAKYEPELGLATCPSKTLRKLQLSVCDDHNVFDRAPLYKSWRKLVLVVASSASSNSLCRLLLIDSSSVPLLCCGFSFRSELRGEAGYLFSQLAECTDCYHGLQLPTFGILLAFYKICSRHRRRPCSTLLIGSSDPVKES